jgi:spermidine/putrescine-binding protein
LEPSEHQITEYGVVEAVKVRSLAIIASLTVAALGVTACASGGGTAVVGSGNGYEPGTLVVMGINPDVNAAWQAEVDKKFTALTGAKIEWLPGSAATNLTKLITSKGGQPPGDVVFLDTTTQPQAAQADLIEKFDRSKLTESGKYLPNSAYPTPGYGPAALVSRLGTCVNTAQLKNAGVTLSGSINDWFNPALRGHFSFPDISSFYTEAALPALATEYNIPFNNPSVLLSKIQQADPVSLWSSTAVVQQQLQSGSIWVSPLIDGRCLNLDLEGLPIRFEPLNLKVNGKTYRYIGFDDTWDIVQGTDKPNDAYAFIDLAEAGMSKLESGFGYLPARTDLLAQARANPKLKGMVSDYNPNDLYWPNYQEWFSKYASTWQNAWMQKFEH